MKNDKLTEIIDKIYKESSKYYILQGRSIGRTVHPNAGIPLNIFEKVMREHFLVLNQKSRRILIDYLHTRNKV